MISRLSSSSPAWCVFPPTPSPIDAGREVAERGFMSDCCAVQKEGTATACFCTTLLDETSDRVEENDKESNAEQDFDLKWTANSMYSGALPEVKGPAYSAIYSSYALLASLDTVSVPTQRILTDHRGLTPHSDSNSRPPLPAGDDAASRCRDQSTKGDRECRRL